MSLQDKLEAKRVREIQERLAGGLTQTKGGQHIFAGAPDAKGQRTVYTMSRTVQDKLPMSNIITDLIKNTNFALSCGYYETFQLGVINALQHVPDIETDEQFWEEIEEAKIVHKVPTGRYAGFGSMTYEIMEEYIEYDPFAVYSAIFNLLRRRGMFTLPKMWDETRVGVLFTRQGQNPPVERKKEKEE